MVELPVPVEHDLVRIVPCRPGARQLVAAHQNRAAPHLPEVLHDQKVVVGLNRVTNNRVYSTQSCAVGLVVRSELILAVQVKGRLWNLRPHIHNTHAVAVHVPIVFGMKPGHRRHRGRSDGGLGDDLGLSLAAHGGRHGGRSSNLSRRRSFRSHPRAHRTLHHPGRPRFVSNCGPLPSLTAFFCVPHDLRSRVDFIFEARHFQKISRCNFSGENGAGGSRRRRVSIAGGVGDEVSVEIPS